MLSWALLIVIEQVEGSVICLRSRKRSSMFLLSKICSGFCRIRRYIKRYVILDFALPVEFYL